MSDIRLSMREFRFLEEKRKLAALSDAEERRWIELGQTLGIFEAGGAPAHQRSDPPDHRAADENGVPHEKPSPLSDAGVDGPANPAPAEEADGFAEVDPEDIIEVDSGDVVLVSAPESEPSPSTLPLTQNFEWVPESAPGEKSIPFETESPGDSAPEHTALPSLESSPVETEPAPSSIPLTQNFEWVPESTPTERSIPFETEAPGETAPEQPALLSPESPPVETEPAPSSIPLTQNFEWVPVSPAFESSLPLETQTPAEAVQLVPEEQTAVDAPVIDLLESDAMQGELQPNSWQGDPAPSVPGDASAALEIGDLAPSEEAQIEPVAQWANEPMPAAFPKEAPVPAQPPSPEPLQPLRASHGTNSTNATESNQVSSSEYPPHQVSSSAYPLPSVQFQVAEALTPPEPPAESLTEGIGEVPTGGEREAEMAPVPIWPDAAAEAPPAPADPPGVELLPEILSDGAAESSSETPSEAPSQSGDANGPFPRAFVSGERRVVVHLIDGQVKRGTVQDLDLTAGTVPLQSIPGVVDNIATDRLKAIFFMLAPGTPRPAQSGQKIRLTFQDGREVVGFSVDFKTGDPGLFLTPADERTNTERIFVPRWSVYSIDEQ